MSDRPSGPLLSACGDPANGNLRTHKLTFDDSAIAPKRDLSGSGVAGFSSTRTATTRP